MDAQQMAMFRQRNVEKLLAATSMVYPVYTVTECGWLSPTMFTDERIREYWRKLLDKVNGNTSDETANEVAIQLALETDLYKELLGWQSDLSYTPMPQAYAHEIARRDYIVNITKLAAELQSAILQFDDETAKRVIGVMNERTQQGHTNLPTALDIAAKFDLALNVSDRRVDTWIGPIDAALGGLERQTLTGLAARPSMGKTALAWQIARNAAIAEYKVAFFSLEQSEIMLWARAACPAVGVTWRDVRAGKVNAETLDELRYESEKLARKYGENLRLSDAGQTTETVWRAVADFRPDLVVIDHLRRFRDKHTSEVKRLGMITESLSDMAKTFNCAVLLAIQLNRNLENRANKRPQLSDLRDSGEIEENLDVCLMMYRDSYYNKPERPPALDWTEVWVTKFRDGPANIRIDLDFNAKEAWFEPRNR